MIRKINLGYKVIGNINFLLKKTKLNLHIHGSIKNYKLRKIYFKTKRPI